MEVDMQKHAGERYFLLIYFYSFTSCFIGVLILI